jgi:hypothetical protein
MGDGNSANTVQPGCESMKARTAAMALARASASRTNPPLPTPPRPTSNWGLTRATSQAPGGGKLERRRQCLDQADETDIGDDGGNGALDHPGIEAPCIGTLQHHHPGVLAEHRMQLVARHIHRIDAGGPTLEQHLGEAPG